MKGDLQDLYRHLDHHARGNMHFAWYAQLRAEGQDHAEAVAATVERFRLQDEPWYQLRFKEAGTEAS